MFWNKPDHHIFLFLRCRPQRMNSSSEYKDASCNLLLQLKSNENRLLFRDFETAKPYLHT
jgi:hypothetical protein